MGCGMDGPETRTHAIVHRRTVSESQPIVAPFTADLFPPSEHTGRNFLVHSQVLWPAITEDRELRGPPQLRLRWTRRAGSRGKIVGFRRPNGLGQDGDFGERIVNCRSDGQKIEPLAAGDYYYTFCTVTSIFGLWRIYTHELQFNVVIPSVERVLGLMRQAIEFRTLEKRYKELTTPKLTPITETAESHAARFEREFAEAMEGIGGRLEAVDRLNREWSARKKAIEDGPYTAAQRKRMLRSLGSAMRDLREQFKL
jgi:hypothetical protein